MKNFIILLIIANLIAYGIISFYFMSFSPYSWGMGGRFSYLLLAVSFSACSIGVKVITENK